MWSDVITLSNPHACPYVQSVDNSGVTHKKQYAMPTHCYFCFCSVLLCADVLFRPSVSGWSCSVLLAAIAGTYKPGTHGSWYYNRPTPLALCTRSHACETRTPTAALRAKHHPAATGMPACPPRQGLLLLLMLPGHRRP